MKHTNRYGLKQLRKDFPNDQSCLQFAFDTLHSKECACGGEYSPVKGRKQFYCTRCRKQISPLAQTIFRRSLVPLTRWFEAILMIEGCASIREVQLVLGVGYKTAWRVKKLLLLAQSQKIPKGRLGLFVRAITVKPKR